MLDHLAIQVADIEASAKFYDSVLAPLGYERVLDFGEVVGFGREGRPQFWLGPVTTKGEAREVHVAFEAADREQGRRISRRSDGRGSRGPPRTPGISRVPPELLRGFCARPGREQRRGCLSLAVDDSLCTGTHEATKSGSNP